MIGAPAKKGAMTHSVSYVKDGATLVINAEQICSCVFNKDGSVSIKFAKGDITMFSDMSDGEADALKRALQISPA